MKSVLILIGCVVTIIRGNPFRVPPNIQIAPASESSLPVVTKVNACDGPGKISGWRFSGCKSFQDGICTVPLGDLHMAEWDFIPNEDIQAIGLRIGVLNNNGTVKTVFQKEIDNSNVVAGNEYTISFLGGARNETKGKSYTVQASLFRVGDDFRIEACARAPFNFV